MVIIIPFEWEYTGGAIGMEYGEPRGGKGQVILAPPHSLVTLGP